MDYDESRRRDKHRDSKKGSSGSSSSSSSRSHHKSHKQLINEHLSDNYNDSSNYKRSRSRSRSRSRDRSHKHHKYNSSNDVKPRQEDLMDTYKHYAGTPSSTIMLRQLPLYLSDIDLRAELSSRNVPIRECRLVKSRDTGASRGFAFIEFNSIEEAQYWLESVHGFLMICDTRVQLYYSQPRYDDDGKGGRRPMLQATDWDCFKCGIKNFKRRDCCFKCSITREDSEKMREGEGYEHIGTTPCNTLVLRGLDALSSEETIRFTIAHLTNIYPKNVHIAKDFLTNISSGFGFVELNSIQEASIVLNLLQNIQPFFEIDGKQINVDYCKNNYTTAIAQLGTKTMYPLPHNNPNHESKSNNSNRSKINQADAANSAAAVAQAALKSMQKKQEIINQLTNYSTDGTSSVTSIKAYVTPDVSTYTYDEVSGYYYDPMTGYYYDSKSQYYYNSTTQQYMYWDASSFSYIIVNNDQSNSTSTTTTSSTDTSSYNSYSTNVQSSTTTTTTTTNTTTITSDIKETKTSESVETPQTTEKVDNKKSKINSAALIAKNMEKWAESMNKKKDAKKVVTTTSGAATTTTATTTVTTTIPTVSNFINSNTELSKKEISPPPPSNQPSSIINASAIIKKVLETNKTEFQTNESNENESFSGGKEVFDEKKFIDYNKLACLLCKRGFDSVDLLNKHVQMSTLHKTNLDKYKQENQQSSSEKKNVEENNDSLSIALQYRDRAKERREKYGVPEPPFKSDVRERLGIDTSYPTPTEYSTPKEKTTQNVEKTYDSIGSKLMRKMGWSEGSGLGKKNHGITTPIEASVRQRGLGLGASGADFDPNDTYKDCVKKSARARFEQLN